jgi:hypothetical protein
VKELLCGGFRIRNLAHVCKGDGTNEINQITQPSQCTLHVAEAKGCGMKTRRVIFLLLVIANLALPPMRANAQTPSGSSGSFGRATTEVPLEVGLTYTRPSQTTKIHNYLFDAFGPYPIAGAAVIAGINQANNAPPEWRQGAAGYGKRFGSNFGIGAVSVTTRYALAEVLKEDTMYYRCECTGVFPRLRHAVISAVTARHGEDGHRVFSPAALGAPYAGTMTAVYGWYPDRFGAKDALRMGNYNLLKFVGGNIALEFFYGGPHSLLSRLHLNDAHGAPDPGSKP